MSGNEEEIVEDSASQSGSVLDATTAQKAASPLSPKFSAHVFKKEGLKRQHTFNMQLLALLQPHIAAGSEDPFQKDLALAVTELKKRVQLLVVGDDDPEVFKHIDSLESAQELIEDNPALAEFLKNKKKEEDKKKREAKTSANRRFAPYPTPYAAGYPAMPFRTGGSAAWQAAAPQFSFGHSPFSPSTPFRRPQASCFNCGKPGHLARACRVAKSEPRQ